MPEKKELIKTIHTKMMCDCGGEMKLVYNGLSYTMYPDENSGYKYLHECTKCKTKEFYKKRYPFNEILE